MLYLKDGRQVRVVPFDKKTMTRDIINGGPFTDEYVYVLVPYTKIEMKYRKDLRTAHFQIVRKSNLVEK